MILNARFAPFIQHNVGNRLPIFCANPGPFSVKIVDSAQITRAKPCALLPYL
jgi:hypothetical protein